MSPQGEWADELAKALDGSMETQAYHLSILIAPCTGEVHSSSELVPHALLASVLLHPS